MHGIRGVTVTSCLAVLGAHGGAGARTVADLLRYAGAEVELMRMGERLPADAVPVLVARSTGSGLNAAAQLLAAWHPAVPRPWLVVVADVPAPPPLPVRYRMRALGGLVRGEVTVPYLWPLRGADSVDEVTDAKVVHTAAHQLAAALGAR